MHYRNLGKTAMRISDVSLGGMSLPKDLNMVQDIIDEALDHGINYIDTADLYDKGQNEILIGRALGKNRTKIILGTKVGNKFSLEKDGWEWAPSKAYILSAIDESLKRLKTDYIDLYQLHGGTLEDPFDEIIEAFEWLKQQGKIRAYGISSIRPNVIKKYTQESSIDSVMMQYSLLDRRPETSILPLLAEKQISVLARGTLAKGLLVDKPAAQYLNYLEADVQKVQDYIKEIQTKDLLASSIALQFVLSNSAITSAVVGVSNKNQLTDLLSYKHTKKLTEAQFKNLSSILPIHIYTDHL